MPTREIKGKMQQEKSEKRDFGRSNKVHTYMMSDKGTKSVEGMRCMEGCDHQYNLKSGPPD